MSFLAKRLASLKTSSTMLISTQAAKLRNSGIDIIDLSIGEPDFDTPISIKKDAKLAIDAGKTKYTVSSGTIELRQAIIHKFKRENNLSYTEDEITVGCGGKQILFNALFSTLNPGDEVIIPAPYWVSYPYMTLMNQGIPVILNCHENNNFKINYKELDKIITSKTKWLIINSPANPTGSVYSSTELRKIADILLKHKHVYIISDDIYEHIIYDNLKFTNIVQIEPKLKERVLICNGVSKSYAMTGWRLGYAASNKFLISAMNIVQSHSNTHACSISQAAAVSALNGRQDFIIEQNEILKNRRNLLCTYLNQCEGLSCSIPKGAFYIYPSCAGIIGKKTPENKIIKTDNDFVSYLLDSQKVALIPGSAFGMPLYLRISYAISTDILLKACNRIKKACSDLQ